MFDHHLEVIATDFFGGLLRQVPRGKSYVISISVNGTCSQNQTKGNGSEKRSFIPYFVLFLFSTRRFLRCVNFGGEHSTEMNYQGGKRQRNPHPSTGEKYI